MTALNLKRVVGKIILRDEEFFTLIIHIETVLNYCPISNLSNEAFDINAFTSAYCHIGLL